jgi:uncharacterized protein
MLGMWLGRKDWGNKKFVRTTFLVGLSIFLAFEGLSFFIKGNEDYWKYWDYIMSDYFPAYIPYIMITTGFALMVISICMFLGSMLSGNKLVLLLSKTGQMTLTHYVVHLTIGMLVLAILANKPYTGYVGTNQPTAPIFIFMYSIAFFLLSVTFSYFWSKKFKRGPLESILRKISGRSVRY